MIATSEPKPFSVCVKKAPDAEDGVAIVEIEGFLDAHTAQDFEKAIEGWLRDGYARFVLDAAKLRYISSAGIGSVMRLVQEARRREGEVIMLKPPEKVFGVLELLGFSEIITFSDTLDEALAGFAAR